MLLNPDGTVNTLKRFANRCINPDDPALWKTTYEYNSNLETTRIVFPRENAGEIDDNSVEFTYSNEDDAALGFVADSDPRTHGNLIRVRRFGTVDGAQEILESRMTYTQPFNRLRSSQSPRAIANDPLSYTAANMLPPVRTSGWVSTFYYDFDENLYGDLNDNLSDNGRSNGNMVFTVSPKIGEFTDSPEFDYEFVSSKYQYSPEGLLLKTIDPVGVEATFEYESKDYDDDIGTPDELGYLIATHRNPSNLNLTSTYTRDDRGNVTTVVSPRGNDLAETYTVGTFTVAETFTMRFYFNDRDQLYQVQSPPTVHGINRDQVVSYDSISFFDRNGNVAASVYEDIKFDSAEISGAGGHVLIGDDRSHEPNLSLDVTDFSQIDAAYPSQNWIRSNYDYDILNLVISASEDVMVLPGPAFGAIRRTSRIFRDDNDNVILTVAPEGNTSALIYDERDLPYQSIIGHDADFDADFTAVGFPSATEAVSIFSFFDANGNPVKSIDGRGIPAYMFYDGFDRPIASVDAIGHPEGVPAISTSLTNQSIGGEPYSFPVPTSGNFGSLAYDEDSNVIAMISGGYSNIGDDTNPVTGVNDQIFSASATLYDELGRPFESFTLAENASGSNLLRSDNSFATSALNYSRSKSFYRENSQVLAAVDDAGNQSYFEYDSANRLETAMSPPVTPFSEYDFATPNFDTNGRTRTVFTRNASGSVTQTETFEFNEATTGFDRYFMSANLDSHGRAFETFDEREVKSSVWFDSRSNVPYSVDREGYVSRAEFDSLSRPVLTHRALTRTPGAVPFVPTAGDFWITQSSIYDNNSRLLEYSDDNGNVTRSGVFGPNSTTPVVPIFDSLSRPSGTTYADDTTQRILEYNDNSMPTRVQDQNGTIVGNIYHPDADILIRREVMAAADIDITNGEGTAITSVLSGTTTSTNPSSILYGKNIDARGTTTESFLYDGAYRNIYADNDASIVTGQYNTFSQRESEDQFLRTRNALFPLPADNVQSLYDTLGSEREIVYPSGEVARYSRDGLLRVSAISFAPASGGFSSLIENKYAGTGWRLIERQNGNGTAESRLYERSDCGCFTTGRVNEIAYSGSSGDFARYSYGFDNVDNVITEVHHHETEFDESKSLADPARPYKNSYLHMYDGAYRLVASFQGAHDTIESAQQPFLGDDTQFTTSPTLPNVFRIAQTFSFDGVNNRQNLTSY
ncbi:MAG: hypothetical protein NUW37_06330, partial [Planctomycetes bacterium]|nr:hypothetical protein [Planctomycetota bacterium]